MNLRTALVGIAVALAFMGCSSVEGIELRLETPSPDEARAIVSSTARDLGFSQDLPGCNTTRGEWCAGRPSPYASWPLEIATQAQGGGLKVFVGRRNIGLTKEERALIASLVRKIRDRGVEMTIERTHGVRLPKDLRPLLAQEAA